MSMLSAAEGSVVDQNPAPPWPHFDVCRSVTARAHGVRLIGQKGSNPQKKVYSNAPPCWVLIIIINFLGINLQFKKLWWKCVKNTDLILQRACDEVILSKKHVIMVRKRKKEDKEPAWKSLARGFGRGPGDSHLNMWLKCKKNKKTRPAGDGARPEGCHGVCAPFSFLISYSCS